MTAASSSSSPVSAVTQSIVDPALLESVIESALGESIPQSSSSPMPCPTKLKTFTSAASAAFSTSSVAPAASNASSIYPLTSFTAWLQTASRSPPNSISMCRDVILYQFRNHRVELAKSKLFMTKTIMFRLHSAPKLHSASVGGPQFEQICNFFFRCTQKRGGCGSCSISLDRIKFCHLAAPA